MLTAAMAVVKDLCLLDKSQPVTPGDVSTLNMESNVLGMIPDTLEKYSTPK
jgi:hypothetical protein